MKTPYTFLHEIASADDFDDNKGELKELINVSRIPSYMREFAEACIKEDRKRIKYYLELYPKADPNLAPSLIFED